MMFRALLLFVQCIFPSFINNKFNNGNINSIEKYFSTYPPIISKTIYTNNHYLLNKNKNTDLIKQNVNLKKYKAIYKTLFNLPYIKSNLKTIKFKTIIINFIMVKMVYSIYNNCSDMICVLELFNKSNDVEDIKHLLEILNFINVVNVFNIFTYLEIYDHYKHFSDNNPYINKKVSLYRKYIKIYLKDCFIRKYI